MLSQGSTSIETEDKALAAARAAQDKRGENITLIDLKGRSGYADVLLLVSAYSDRQTGAIADGIIRALREDGMKPISKEGEGSWILVDYGDLVVHVFHEDTRAYYDLDRLWGDAPRIQVPPPANLVANDA